MIYLFTGQPHSGKTTLSRHLAKVISTINPEKPIHVIDGDDFRKIYKNIDYSEKGRTSNITTAHRVAIYLNSIDCDVIIAMVSPFKELRDDLKENYGAIEIYVHTSEIRGRENFHVNNYEIPSANFIDIDTTEADELTSLNEILNGIESINPDSNKSNSLREFSFNEKVVWDSNFGYEIGYFLDEGNQYHTYLIDMKTGLIHEPCSHSKSEIHKYSEELIDKLSKKYGYEKRF